MKEVALTRGKLALVDDEDFERVSKLRWYCLKIGYAATEIPRPNKRRIMFYLHRFILDAQVGMDVDHIDGDPLNNQRSNLRVCTHSQNGMNQRKRRQETSSGFKGVSWKKDKGKWRADICASGKSVFLGYYQNELSAAIAYDAGAKRLHGEFAKPNFPIMEVASV